MMAKTSGTHTAHGPKTGRDAGAGTQASRPFPLVPPKSGEAICQLTHVAPAAGTMDRPYAYVDAEVYDTTPDPAQSYLPVHMT